MSAAYAIIAALPYPAVMVGADDRIAATNEPAEVLLGPAAAGRHYVTILRQPRILGAIDLARTTSKAQQTQFTGNDGVRDTVWDATVAVLSPDDATLLISFTDRSAVDDADAMRRDFVANVSHELRTPLTSIMGFIETLRGPASDDAAARNRFLQIMTTEARRMHRLIEDLLSLSRVENQERIRPKDTVALGPLVLEACDAIRPVADAAGVVIKTSLPDDAVEIIGAVDQLWQVLRNLLENAIKYGASGGQVTVTLGAPTYDRDVLQNAVRISVADTGDGIAVHHIARLTERFYRVDNHRSREIGGTGLGLAITKHIITRHRGRLIVKSTLGQGSDFTVVLPVSA
jgi:two-component system phosphate regulon sensor histidine kinase PhoR